MSPFRASLYILVRFVLRPFTTLRMLQSIDYGEMWREVNEEPDQAKCDVLHNFVQDPNDHGYCRVCGAVFYDHCPTGEHTVRTCPGDHGK